MKCENIHTFMYIFIKNWKQFELEEFIQKK